MTTVRRFVQSALALALCIVIAGWLGGFYAVPALAAMLVAMSTGAYVLIAVGAAVLWPVLCVAFVMHVTRDAKLRATTNGHDPTRRVPPGEPGVLGVEDP